jgi:hypothetical protein
MPFLGADIMGKTLPGHLWSADDQCKYFYGANATYCRVILKYNSLINKNNV